MNLKLYLNLIGLVSLTGQPNTEDASIQAIAGSQYNYNYDNRVGIVCDFGFHNLFSRVCTQSGLAANMGLGMGRVAPWNWRRRRQPATTMTMPRMLLLWFLNIYSLFYSPFFSRLAVALQLLRRPVRDGLWLAAVAPSKLDRVLPSQIRHKTVVGHPRSRVVK